MEEWKKLNKTETVEVTVNVPKGLMQFLEDNKANNEFDTVKEYLEDALIDRTRADIDASVFAPTVEGVAEQYGLKKEFKIKE